MTSALPLRQSWLKTIALRAIMATSLIAWKFYGIENAGNLFAAITWLMSAIALLMTLDKPTAITVVLTPAQKSFAEWYRWALLLVLAWYGLYLLGVVYLIGALCTLAHQAKFDRNGVPLAKTGGTA